MKMGIDKYNAECRAIVMRYSSEWRATVERMGRWIDFDNDYKTLNLPFMESVWWAFSELFKKGLVYRGLRVMPYSTGCLTPLSNFEAGQNYKDVSDPAGMFLSLLSNIMGDTDTDQLLLLSHLWTTHQHLYSHGRPRHGRFHPILHSACTPISLTSKYTTNSTIKTSFSLKHY